MVWAKLTISRLICHDFIKCDKNASHKIKQTTFRPNLFLSVSLCFYSFGAHLYVFHAFVSRHHSSRESYKSIHLLYSVCMSIAHIYNGCMQLFIPTPHECLSLCHLPNWCYTFKMQFFQTHFKFQQTNETNEQTDLFMLENKMSTTILTHCCFHIHHPRAQLSFYRRCCCRHRYRRGWLHFLSGLFFLLFFKIIGQFIYTFLFRCCFSTHLK